MTNLAARRILLVASLLSLLAGCTSSGWGLANPPEIPKATAVRTLVNGVNGSADTNTTVSAPEYALGGYQLARSACDTYFDDLIEASNDVQMSKADIAAAGVAAATIASLAHASTKAVGVTAAAAGLVGILLDNYQNYALITPYPVQTRSLVLGAMDTYRNSKPPENATSLMDASDRIAGYAEICTYSNIAALAAQAIATAKTTDTGGATSLFSASERATVLQPVKDMLGLSSATLTDDNFAELAIIGSSDGSDAAKKLNPVIAKLLPTDVAAAAYDGGTQGPTAKLKSAQPLLGTLATNNKAFADRIAAIKAANVQSIAATDQVNAAAAARAGPGQPFTPSPVLPVAPPTPEHTPHIEVRGS
jgi:hypothetical protein